MQAMAASTTALIRAREISKTYISGALRTPALNGITLDIRSGEFALLMGPSGSGKTTLLSILSGLMRPSAGEVELCGVAITGLPEAAAAQVRRNKLGFVFQTYNLFPALTALDNVAEVLALKGFALAPARAKAKAILAQVGLADRLAHRPGELSGGQRQRVAIARALAGDPALVVGDEPTGSLDKNTGLAVMQLLKEQITPQRGVLIVSHDTRLLKFADRVLEIEDGRIVSDRRVAGGEHGQENGVDIT
jgi:putative ABC transport system ATP-binding protein